MATLTQETRIELEQYELVGLTNLERHTIRCESGALWITIDGDTRDMVLPAGKDWAVDSRNTVVVSALQASNLLITAAIPVGTLAIAFGPAADSMLSLVKRWKHPSLAAYPAQILR